MTAAERAILVELDQILRSEKVRTLIRPMVERVHAKLSRETGALMAWEPIPQNVWHQPVISKETDWVAVSFHTVPAEELIEERPESSGQERTKQMRYLG